jgi:ribonuclease VapC
MIVDSSALVAVVFKEPGYEALLGKLAASRPRGAGAPTLTEAGIVMSARLGKDATELLSGLVRELEIDEVPFGEAHWRHALAAYWRFGRGRHPARLNFGDCISYAVATLAGLPLLYTGEDFSKTDVQSA